MTRQQKALEIIRHFSQIDGAHHKAWCIDQVVRALTGPDYEQWITAYKDDDHFSWDEGIAP